MLMNLAIQWIQIERESSDYKTYEISLCTPEHKNYIFLFEMSLERLRLNTVITGDVMFNYKKISFPLP